jgi:SPP1 family predicted phage head-tail adaptor
MRAGQLRHKVVIEKPGTRVDDTMGGGTLPFETHAEVYASIEPLTGNELLRGGQLESTLTHRIRTRYVAGVRPSYQVRSGSRVFDIDRVIDPEERHRELELICTEQVTW